jgi:hypothetical protein
MPLPLESMRADAQLLTLQRPQNRVLGATGSLDMCTPVRELQVYDYITILCRAPAEVILNHVNPNVCGSGQGEARHRKYKRLNIYDGHAYDRSAD